MTRTGSFIAVIAAVGFAASAASAQTPGPGVNNSTNSIPGAPVQQGTVGSSGQTVGTVTAPSIGTSTQPSVGVTNSVPTWKSTNPPAR
ncbi:hypothetical protein [Bradyrhizobium japonicum]|uniref:hypothetical protein n=1 Tax=Bradyrhizobium japonicum TaxID=375 RepID=UPI002011ED65|nr:hypothetical protein [Bradyrhizobium japonicum]